MPDMLPPDPAAEPSAHPPKRAQGLQWLLFETAPHGIIIHDAKGAIIDANPAAERLLGVSLSDVKDGPMVLPGWQLIREDGSPYPLEDRPGLVALRTGKPVEPSVIGRRSDKSGEVRWVSVAAMPLFLANSDQPYASIAMFVDVTAQKSALALLQASEARFRTAFEASPAMMAISDLATGRFLDVNESYCEVTGYSRAELIGQRSIDLGIVEADARATLLEAMTQYGRVRNYEVPIRTRSGERRVVLMAGEVLDMADTRCLLTIGMDITAG